MDVLQDESGSLDTLGLFFVGVAGLIALIFVLVFATLLFAAVKGLSVWNRNNNSPVVTVPAVLLTKRQEHHRSQENSSTAYYVAFELPGHERREWRVTGPEWGTLVEGDRGQLTYQGTRYKGFARVPQDR